MTKVESLWEYQQAETALEGLEATIKSTPSRVQLAKLRVFLADQQKQLDKLAQEVASAREQVEKLDARLSEHEAEYQKQSKKLDGVDTPSDAEALRKALEDMYNGITEDRRELYNILQWTQKANTLFDTVWKKATKAKKEYDVLRETCEKELDGYKAQLDGCKAKIKDCEKKVDKDLLKKYKAIKSNTPMPVAQFTGNQCGGCKLNLPVVVGHRLKSGDAIVECENCGRILYLP